MVCFLQLDVILDNGIYLVILTHLENQNNLALQGPSMLSKLWSEYVHPKWQHIFTGHNYALT